MAERRKKKKDEDQGKETPKKPRPKKTRTTSRTSRGSSSAKSKNKGGTSKAKGGTSKTKGGTSKAKGRTRKTKADTVSPSTAASTPAPAQPAPAQEQENTPRAPLPGELYQETDGWWWRVKLPGEDKATARLLKPAAAGETVCDRETAERIAFEVWEAALQENAARQVKLESAEKIERLKAQFLDKVRHFTELVEAANAKIEAEAKARAEAEAKLAQLAQTQEPGIEDREEKPQDTEKPTAQTTAPVADEPNAAVPAAPPQDAEASAGAPPTDTDRTVPGEDENPEPELPAAADIEAPPVSPATPPPTGMCECCGAISVALACLQPIDSGQLLCPRCLAALRSDVARIEAEET